MRVPRLALLSWALASVLIAAVVAAMWHYLDGRAPSTHAMHAMTGMSVGDAITRGGADPLRPLLSSAVFTAWQLDAPALALVVVLGAAYLTAVALVPVRTPGSRWPLSSTICYFAGLAVIVFATCGSIAVYDQVLFTAHMAGHLALVMLAPALLVAGRPMTLALAASTPVRQDSLRAVFRSRVLGVLTTPPVALASYAVVIVVSHLTGLMDTIMRSTWAGQLEHLVYLLVGYQFFVLVIGREPIRWQLSSPVRWLLLAIAMAVDTFTGVVLLQGTRAVHLMSSDLQVDALSDTRTGGAIMWVGGDAIMAIVMIGLVVNWLRAADSAVNRSGWTEQARRSRFSEVTGSDDEDALDDDGDAARSAYNAWLTRLDRS